MSWHQISWSQISWSQDLKISRSQDLKIRHLVDVSDHWFETSPNMVSRQSLHNTILQDYCITHTMGSTHGKGIAYPCGESLYLCISRLRIWRSSHLEIRHLVDLIRSHDLKISRSQDQRSTRSPRSQYFQSLQIWCPDRVSGNACYETIAIPIPWAAAMPWIPT